MAPFQHKNKSSPSTNRASPKGPRILLLLGAVAVLLYLAHEQRNNITSTATGLLSFPGGPPPAPHSWYGDDADNNSKYQSPYLVSYTPDERLALNADAAVEERRQQRSHADRTYPSETAIPAFYFAKLVLRTITHDGSIFGYATQNDRNGQDPAAQLFQSEPFLGPLGRRNNGGCPQNSPTCVLTWDGWARARASGDVLYDVVRRRVPGHVVEVGVFKGGMAAYFQALLMILGQTAARELWLVDSFQGLPSKDKMVSKVDDSHNKFNGNLEQAQWQGKLSVGAQTVRRYLDRLGLMDAGNVKFLEGFVEDSLPNWKEAQEIAVLRVDVDIYSATFDALHYLYPRLSVGGAVLFDDWKYEYSAEAVKSYRAKNGITEPIQFLQGPVDPMAYWIKES